MATITLAISIARNNMTLADQEAQIAGVILNNGEYALFGLTQTSDVTAGVGTDVVRTIVLQTTAESNLNFPGNANKIANMNNIFTARLGLMTNSTAESATPVIS